MTDKFKIAGEKFLQLINKEDSSLVEVQTQFNEYNALRKKLPITTNKEYLRKLEQNFIGIQGAINEKFRVQAHD